MTLRSRRVLRLWHGTVSAPQLDSPEWRESQ
jgi:hypothetical protein